MSICTITTVGNLGVDPESKDVGGGTVCNFSVAHNRKIKGEETTTWFRVAAWGKLGEICQKYLSKGSAVAVSGRFVMREYTNKDGEDRVSLEIEATDVQFVGGRASESGGSGAAGSSGSTSQEDDIPFLNDGFPSYGERHYHANR